MIPHTFCSVRLRRRACRPNAGMTLLETVISLAVFMILMAVLLPQFRILHKSWGLSEASAESVQNARVLYDHMHRRISTASKVTAIGESEGGFGFIEFKDSLGQIRRYEVCDDRCVYYGRPGEMFFLAGPVGKFKISGYAPDCPEEPPSNAAAMRLIRLEAEMACGAEPSKTMPLNASIFLHTDPPAQEGWSKIE